VRTRHLRCFDNLSLHHVSGGKSHMVDTKRLTAGEGALASLEVDLVRDEDLPRPALSSGRKDIFDEFDTLNVCAT
jgi:hypothetical protein